MYDVITIGDAMRDIFLFPDIEGMEKPVTDQKLKTDEHFDKYLVFGLGDKVTINESYLSLGGAAANVACGLAKMKLKTAIITSVGGDNIGEDILENLEKQEVGTEFVKTYKNRKSSFSVIVSYKGERTIFVYHSFHPEDFILPKELNSDWVYLGPMAKGFEPVYNKVTAEVVKNNLQVAINPGTVQIDAGLESFGGLLELINIMFLNREEAQKLSGLPGVPTIKDTAKVIQLRGPRMVVITDGKDGACVYDGEDFFQIGVYPGHRLEATGAGDAFATGFLSSVIYGNDLRESLKWGVINSASVIEKYGAQEGLLSRSLIKRRVKEYRWPADTLRFS